MSLQDDIFDVQEALEESRPDAVAAFERVTAALWNKGRECEQATTTLFRLRAALKLIGSELSQ